MGAPVESTRDLESNHHQKGLDRPHRWSEPEEMVVKMVSTRREGGQQRGNRDDENRMHFAMVFISNSQHL
jgi:hypothetical protein